MCYSNANRVDGTINYKIYHNEVLGFLSDSSESDFNVWSISDESDDVAVSFFLSFLKMPNGVWRRIMKIRHCFL